MIAVSRAPISTPRIGLVNTVKSWVNSGTLARGFTAADMASIPNISTAKPSRIVPTSSFFFVMRMIIPISAKIGVKELGFSS